MGTICLYCKSDDGTILVDKTEVVKDQRRRKPLGLVEGARVPCPICAKYRVKAVAFDHETRVEPKSEGQ